MDLENEKIGPAYSAPDSYFKETESRLMQRLGIQLDEAQAPIVAVTPSAPLDTTGVQKRARKQDPITAKSEGINKEVDALGNVVIPPLTFTTNENPEWVNFGAIAEEVSGEEQGIKVVSYGDLLNNTVSTSSDATTTDPITNVTISTDAKSTDAVSTDLVLENTSVEFVNTSVESVNTTVIQAPVTETTDPEIPTTVTVLEEANDIEAAEQHPRESSMQPVEETTVSEPAVIVHEVPESVGLDELESYISAKSQPNTNQVEQTPETTVETAIPMSTPRMEEVTAVKELDEKPISLEAPATAFAPIAGRQRESATPGWLGVAAALAAIVAAYFIWTAIQPPKLDTEEVVLQQEEATIPEAPLDEQVPTDTIPDGLQLVEPLIMEEMPKYKEPNVYTIIDAEDMPERTKKALQDLEDNGLATFDMEDELFEELDFESL